MEELPEIIGRYQLVRPLGHGAMGRVVLAHDPILDRPVAIKLLRDDLGLNAEQRDTLLDRMRQEARASARVSHPNIVALHDMGESPEFDLYLVFEHVEGKNLKERLKQGPLDPEAAAELVRGLGAALTTAHSAGVLHRDIKPENIILAKHGPKLVDFGIARLPDSTLTHDGGILGTPAYAAPESIANGKFTPLSDQFSLAATLYEAISGHRAFPGDDAVAVAAKIATEEPPGIAALCGLDPRVDTVLARGMSKVPRSRYESAEDFGAALAEALHMSPRSQLNSRVGNYLDETVHPAPRGIRFGIGAAAAILLVIGVVIHFSRQFAPAPAEPMVQVSAAPSVIAPEELDQPIGYLAERPPDKKKRPKRLIFPNALDSRKDPGADAGAPSEGRPDAGAPPSEPSHAPVNKLPPPAASN